MCRGVVELTWHRSLDITLHVVGCCRNDVAQVSFATCSSKRHVTPCSYHVTHSTCDVTRMM